LVTSKQADKVASFRTFQTRALDDIKRSAKKGLEFVLYETSGLRAGTLANVPWLLEFPDPVTKITWDNYLCVSPKMAIEQGYREGQLLEVTVGSRTREVPVHIQPGQHDRTVSLAVGYGRTAAGKVGNGVGVAAFDLASVNGDQIVYSGLEVKIVKPEHNKSIQLANIQGHQTMAGREIILEATLEDFKKSPDKVIPKEKIFSLWDKHKYPGHKWAMAVDLNSCTACGACIIACQSENNIPTVGKKYVLKGREMHWMRVDRYYTGHPAEPDTLNQPVMCQHCDNAPCETVCPVEATVHSDEGTNDMIYNRCVGTRYCANNCPYKVRRFNWFNYTKVRAPMEMAMNPEVTVRDRGVMEKCTFCTHRIKYEKNKALTEKRAFDPASVKTACQQSCPADVIVFGDINDPNSEVAKAFKNIRSYSLLEELDTVPAVRYQYKVRNTANLKGERGGEHEHQVEEGGHA